MKKKQVSLKDIAAELGVSATLVSYVINNKEKEGRVGKEMAEKIREAARRLNYQPNHFARGLKVQKSRSIGLIVADISNPFFANMARIIEDEAWKNDYTVIIGSSDEKPDKMERVLRFLSSRQVDGFIIVPTEGSQEQLADLLREKIPFVLVDRRFEDMSCNSVMTDNFLTTAQAIDRLLMKGSKRIGLIMYQSTLNNYKERLNGYLHSHRRLGIEVDESLIKEVPYGDAGETTVHAIVEELLSNSIDSIFFTTNTLTISGLKAIAKIGLRIPEDIRVLAFDQNDIINFFDYPVPQVIQPIKEICEESVSVLIEQIEKGTGKISNTVFAGKIVGGF